MEKVKGQQKHLESFGVVENPKQKEVHPSLTQRDIQKKNVSWVSSFLQLMFIHT